MWQVKHGLVLCLGSLLCMASFVASAQALRDPTAPPRAPAMSTVERNPTTAIKLQAIVWRENQRSAVISGQRVAVGDPISNYIVQAIEMNHVTLLDTSNQQRIDLKLFHSVQQEDLTTTGKSGGQP